MMNYANQLTQINYYLNQLKRLPNYLGYGFSKGDLIVTGTTGGVAMKSDNRRNE